MTFQNILDDYRLREKDRHITHCKNQKNLVMAIDVAACSLDAEGRLHPHQYRVGYKTLKQFADHLKSFEKELNQARDFDELLNIIYDNRTFQIGPLTAYDIAERLGIYLGKIPNKVYLHCGAKEGAIRLLGQRGNKKYLLVTDFPKAWQKAKLNAQEIENILCRYKKYMHPNLS